ncbi:hypothetical protein M885DRAFT_567839 [Pelagophyceae sp. CCMP2097]|nr:hypothetical protein M885DRAFT_567839 [Pelagophyceae sp. CCMP2097]
MMKPRKRGSYYDEAAARLEPPIRKKRPPPVDEPENAEPTADDRSATQPESASPSSDAGPAFRGESADAPAAGTGAEPDARDDDDADDGDAPAARAPRAAVEEPHTRVYADAAHVCDCWKAKWFDETNIEEAIRRNPFVSGNGASTRVCECGDEYGDCDCSRGLELMSFEDARKVLLDALRAAPDAAAAAELFRGAMEPLRDDDSTVLAATRISPGCARHATRGCLERVFTNLAESPPPQP